MRSFKPKRKIGNIYVCVWCQEQYSLLSPRQLTCGEECSTAVGREYSRNYYHINLVSADFRNKKRMRLDLYQKNNREKHLASQARWREKNRDYNKIWREKNRDYNKIWREKNRDYKKIWREKNKKKKITTVEIEK